MEKVLSKLSIIFTLFLIIISFSSTVFATDITADYNILNTETRVSYEINTQNTLNNYFIPIPNDAKHLDINFVKDSQEYEIIISDNEKYILFEELTSKVLISFDSDLFIDDGSDTYFISDFNDFDFNTLSISVTLPKDANLKYKLSASKSSFIPDTGKLTTDGQRIILKWTDEDFINNSAILIIYKTNSESRLIYMMIIILVLLILLSFIMIKKKGKILKIERDLTTNLYEDEKLIIDTLLRFDDRELWQKELQLRTKLSKVKLSRKIRSLQNKGLVEKISYGNTNKIRIKNNSQ